jgi:hypothetical protein
VVNVPHLLVYSSITIYENSRSLHLQFPFQKNPTSHENAQMVPSPPHLRSKVVFLAEGGKTHEAEI